MCAINGFNFSDRNLIEKMNKVTSHRGPDQTDFWIGSEISLGHNRLSIIDLSDNGNQPMWDEKREIAIIFNGEIYNFKELRQGLEKKYRFKSQSDTEVLLCAYKEYGLGCLNKLNGIFAFAIWDERRKELLLARDRVGIKPLYYYWDGRKFIFSSEIKSILTHNLPRAVDQEAFNLYFHVLYVPEPHTMFKGIKKLPAANYLTLKGSQLEIKKYWEVTNFENLPDERAAIEEIQSLFKDSVKRQLISDRPVGVFLSGGLDSTAVLGAIRENTSKQIKAFSVRFNTKIDSAKYNADFDLAEKTAEAYGIEFYRKDIGPKDISDNLERIVWHMDEPSANPIAGVTFLLAQEAKKKVAVVLGGDGGDELFGGYLRYNLSRLIGYYQRSPALMDLFFEKILRGIGKKYWAEKLSARNPAKRILSFLSQKQKFLDEIGNSDFMRPEIAIRYFSERYPFNQLYGGDFEKYFMNVDRQSWLVDESLLRTDKMTMAFGLEERVPILDHRLVELANRIPTHWKTRGFNPLGHFQGKAIWRKAIKKYLKPHMAREQKRGWFSPMAKWLREEELRGVVSDILSPQNLSTEFFDAGAVQKIWKEHLDKKTYNLSLIWAIVMWQLWYNQFIKK